MNQTCISSAPPSPLTSFSLPSHPPLSLPSHFPLIPLHLPSHFVSHPSYTHLPTLSIPLTSLSPLSFCTFLYWVQHTTWTMDIPKINRAVVNSVVGSYGMLTFLGAHGTCLPKRRLPLDPLWQSCFLLCASSGISHALIR